MLLCVFRRSLQYDGYSASPVLTAKDKWIMAECNWDGDIKKTSRETSFWSPLVSAIYWHSLVKYVY